MFLDASSPNLPVMLFFCTLLRHRVSGHEYVYFCGIQNGPVYSVSVIKCIQLVRFPALHNAIISPMPGASPSTFGPFPFNICFFYRGCRLALPSPWTPGRFILNIGQTDKCRSIWPLQLWYILPIHFLIDLIIVPSWIHRSITIPHTHPAAVSLAVNFKYH